MISFRSQKDTLSSVVILASLLAILGLAMFLAFAPQPSAAGLAKAKRIAQEKLETEIETAKKQAQEADKSLAGLLRTGTAEKLTPNLLAEVSQMAQTSGLKVNAFRPQKTVLVGELTQIPFVLTVEGAFSSVAALLRKLEDPTTRLGVTLIQLSSTDGGSDQVTATIGLSVYTEVPPSAPVAEKEQNGKA